MNTDNVIALIAAIGGTAGLVSAVSALIFKILDYRKTKRGETIDAKLQPIVDKLEAQDVQLHEIRLDTTRTQLIMLMEHQPHNYDTIIKVAERYFCTLQGDWYLTSLFKDWAKREGVSIPADISAATINHE